MLFPFLPELFPVFEPVFRSEELEEALFLWRDSAEARPPALATRSRVSLSADARPRFEFELLSC